MPSPLLFKYAPVRNPRGKQFAPKTLDGILKFKADGTSLIDVGLYLTPTANLLAPLAEKALSLTYQPRFIYSGPIEPPLNGLLRNPYGGRQPSRVWPAFGQTGAGLEILLTQGIFPDSRERMIARQLKATPFYINSIQSERVLTILRAAIPAWLRRAQPDVLERTHPEDRIGGLVGRITRGSGMAFSWPIEDRRLAISCAVHRESNGCFTWARFWAYVWKDDERARTREIWGPIIKDVLFSVNRDLIIRLRYPELARQKGAPIDPDDPDGIEAILEELRTQIIIISTCTEPEAAKFYG